MKNLKLYNKRLLALSLVLTTTLSGCVKSNCSIKETHVHKYMNDYGFTTYFNEEEAFHDSFFKTNEYITVNKEELELIEWLDKKDLISVSDGNNKDLLKEILEKINQCDYIEYQYTKRRINNFYYAGGFIPGTKKVKRWSKDQNIENKTGKTREVKYALSLHTLIKNTGEDRIWGKYTIGNVDVDDIDDIDEDYYIAGRFNQYIDRVNPDVIFEELIEKKVGNSKNYIITDELDIPELLEYNKSENKNKELVK